MSMKSDILQLNGPDRYKLILKDNGYDLTASNGKNHFIGSATKKYPKSYVVSHKKSIIYIGQTSQSMATRLRQGLKAKGKAGYYGYPWRNIRTPLNFDIWTLHGTAKTKAQFNLECIEAEVVYLKRKHSGQWNKHQTEIHFHCSNEFHREAAKKIYWYEYFAGHRRRH